MTLGEIKMLHAYNAWADNRLLDALEGLPPGEYNRERGGSFGSIHATLMHLVGAQALWLARWRGEKDARMSEASSAGTPAEARELWQKTGHGIAQWIGLLTDRKLGETFVSTNAKGETFRDTCAGAFQHMVNHSTYHRGQIAVLMRQAGAAPPPTDLIRFLREAGG
ncbi:MAG: DinB family protein [Bacteroidota bacterium]